MSTYLPLPFALARFDCTRLESNARTGNLKLMNLAYVERGV